MSVTEEPTRAPEPPVQSDSARLILVESRLSPDARCAYCHDTLGELSTVCGGCRTALHASCRAELALCPTLGCRESTFDLLGPVERLRRMRARSIRPGFRRALARLRQRQGSAGTPDAGDVAIETELADATQVAKGSPTEWVRTEIDGLREFLAAERALKGHMSASGAVIHAIMRVCAGEIAEGGSAQPAKPVPLLFELTLVVLMPLWVPLLILVASAGYATIVFPVVAGAAWIQLLPFELELPHLDRFLGRLRSSRAIAWFLAPTFPALLIAIPFNLALGRPLSPSFALPLLALVFMIPGVVAWYRGRVSWTARRVTASPRPGGE